MTTDSKTRFIITKHAEDRMLERLGTHRGKLLKIARKAWRSKIETPTLVRQQYGYVKGGGVEKLGERLFRTFCGYVFIFSLEGKTLRLVTVIDPRERRLGREIQDKSEQGVLR